VCAFALIEPSNMKLLKNSGNERVVDELRGCLAPQRAIDIASPALALFAFGELHVLLTGLSRCRLVLPPPTVSDLALFGADADRVYRNRLQAGWLAKQCAAWLESRAEVKNAPGAVPQSTLVARSDETGPDRVITGTCSFTTEGLSG
jgi:hypothetical protein